MMYETMRFLTALSDNVMSALENFSVVNISKKSRRKKVQLLSLSYLIIFYSSRSDSNNIVIKKRNKE